VFVRLVTVVRRSSVTAHSTFFFMFDYAFWTSPKNYANAKLISAVGSCDLSH